MAGPLAEPAGNPAGPGGSGPAGGRRAVAAGRGAPGLTGSGAPPAAAPIPACPPVRTRVSADSGVQPSGPAGAASPPAGPAGGSRPGGDARLRRRRRRVVAARRVARPWLLLAPALAVLAGLLLYPLVRVVVISTQDFSGLRAVARGIVA